MGYVELGGCTGVVDEVFSTRTFQRVTIADAVMVMKAGALVVEFKDGKAAVDFNRP